MKEKRLLLPAASSLFFVRSESLVKVSVGKASPDGFAVGDRRISDQ